MPQLDIISFPSQIFYLSSVFIIGLYFSLKYILPSARSILHVRKFLTHASIQPLINLETHVATNFIRNFNSSFDDFLSSQNKENFDIKFFSAIKEKQKITEKFFLSPFFFFFANDVFVLMVAFFISLSGIFFYLITHYRDILDTKDLDFFSLKTKLTKFSTSPATLTSLLSKKD
jgi:hypothetical protein